MHLYTKIPYTFSTASTNKNETKISKRKIRQASKQNKNNKKLRKRKTLGTFKGGTKRVPAREGRPNEVVIGKPVV